MLRMMEKYANNLEEVISERTRQLMEEKKKADMLLYRMLPAYAQNSVHPFVCLSVSFKHKSFPP